MGFKPKHEDNPLLHRIRSEISVSFSEKRMFGGVCFMVGRNMALGVTNEDKLMIRVGKETYEQYLEEEEADVMTFTGRPMTGFLYIDHTRLDSNLDLKKWIDRGVRYAASLPTK